MTRMFLHTALTVLVCIAYTSGETTSAPFPDIDAPVQPNDEPTSAPFLDIDTTVEPNDEPTSAPFPDIDTTVEPNDEPTSAPFPDIDTTVEPNDEPTSAPFPDIDTTVQPNGETTSAPFPDIDTTVQPNGEPTSAPFPDIDTTVQPNGETTSAPFPDIDTTVQPNGEPTSAAPLPDTTVPPTFVIEPTGLSCSRAGLASDVLEVGCWGYRKCVNGSTFTYRCLGNTVLERDSLTCIRSATGCNKVVSCKDLPNGLYSDKATGCQMYWWCVEGANFVKMYCPPTLVFNDEIQVCDYPYNVVPPCGTKVLQ